MLPCQVPIHKMRRVISPLSSRDRCPRGLVTSCSPTRTSAQSHVAAGVFCLLIPRLLLPGLAVGSRWAQGSPGLLAAAAWDTCIAPLVTSSTASLWGVAPHPSTLTFFIFPAL